MTGQTLLFAVFSSALAVAAGRASAEEPPAVCPFGPGARPADTLPAGAPHGAQIPIDTIVVLMQENRSFDHYMGRLHAQGKRDSEPLPKTASNPDPTAPGHTIRVFHDPRRCEVADLAHGWTQVHEEFNGGAMDGFTAANANPADPSGRRAMAYYDERDLNFYYALYRRFATADRYFSSLLGPTFPNRYYLVAGTSFGHIDNDLPMAVGQFAQRAIYNLLDEAGVTWRVYTDDLPFGLLFAYVRNHRSANLLSMADYFADARAGTLPQVSFVDPAFEGSRNEENDEHPPANQQIGQAFIASILQALLHSPAWPHAAAFLTYDEHGGFFDHVPPPPACIPDDIPPKLGPGDTPAAFDRYGIRVPFVVVSPFARRRFVSHRVYDHTSILRFIETRHDLPALTRRDANADPMLELFDFDHPDFVQPPHLPRARIERAGLAECAAP